MPPRKGADMAAWQVASGGGDRLPFASSKQVKPPILNWNRRFEQAFSQNGLSQNGYGLLLRLLLLLLLLLLILFYDYDYYYDICTPQ